MNLQEQIKNKEIKMLLIREFFLFFICLWVKTLI